MNFTEELSDALEVRLKKLRPSAVSPERLSKLRSVASVTAAPPKLNARLRPVWAAAAAAAVALVLFSLFECTQPNTRPALPAVTAIPAESAAAELTAESSTEFLVGTRAVGVWTAPDGQMYRVVQCLSMNQTVLRETGKGTQVDVMEPRPRVLLLAMGSQ